MTFTSLTFLAFVLLSAILCSLSASIAWRRLVLLTASLIFLASYVPAVPALLPLSLFFLCGYGAVVLAGRYPDGHVPGIAIAVFVALFLWLKRYPFVAFLPELPFAYLMLGASYVLFRTLHLLMDVRDGRLTAPSFMDYLLYILFFPALLSGPINRFEEFQGDLKAPRAMTADEAIQTLGRGILGFAKVAVLAELVRAVQGDVAASLQGMLAGGSASGLRVGAVYSVGSALYFVFLYLNFSGYMDMALSIARLFGIALPENFDRPFGAINFQDLWSRWHITLSAWFKSYFYNPLLKALFHRWDSRAAAPYLGVVTSFVVFLVLGAWHGASWEFMLIAFSLAVGVSINMLYQIEMAKRLGKRRYQSLTRNSYYVLLSRGLTMAYFAFTLSPIWLSIGQLGTLAGVAGAFGLVAGLLLLSLLFSIFFAVQEQGPVQAIVRLALTPLRLPGRTLRVAALGLAVFLLVILVPAINSPPEFVYKAF